MKNVGHGNFYEDGENSEDDEQLTINDLKDEAKGQIEEFKMSTRRKRGLGNGK